MISYVSVSGGSLVIKKTFRWVRAFQIKHRVRDDEMLPGWR